MLATRAWASAPRAVSLLKALRWTRPIIVRWIQKSDAWRDVEQRHVQLMSRKRQLVGHFRTVDLNLAQQHTGPIQVTLSIVCLTWPALMATAHEMPSQSSECGVRACGLGVLSLVSPGCCLMVGACSGMGDAAMGVAPSVGCI